MGRFRRALAVALVTACLAACSTPGAPTVPFTVLQTAEKPAPTTTTKPPSFTPAASPDNVTAACPFLDTAEVQRLLGTSEDIVAAEQPPDSAFAPGTGFHCRYEGKYVHPWLVDLWIITVPDPGRLAESLEYDKKDCGGPATAVPGAGDGAYFCDRAGTGTVEMVITGKPSHGETRLAVAYLLKHRDEVYTGLAKLLADRL